MLLSSTGVIDAAGVLKQYNAMAATSSKITGGKKVALISLLSAPRAALETLVHTVSSLGDSNPWTDDV